MLKVGIFGMGVQGFRHLEAYSGLDGFEVAAVCDVRPEIGEKVGSVNFYTDYKEMIDKEQLDVVSVVTIGSSHAKIVVSCAEKKIPYILCEKPIATNVKDARKMIEVCKENGSKLAVNHSMRWQVAILKLVELLKTGVIGDVKNIYYSVGGGRLGSVGTHIFDAMKMYTSSDPEWVMGFLDKNYKGDHKGRSVFDPGGYGMIYFKNGVRATIDICEDIGTPDLWVIGGTVGRIIIRDDEFYEVYARSDDDKNKKLGEYDLPLLRVPLDVPGGVDMVSLVRKVVLELCSDKEVSCGGDDGLTALQIALAFHLSEKNGNDRIFLPYEDESFNVEIT